MGHYLVFSVNATALKGSSYMYVLQIYQDILSQFLCRFFRWNNSNERKPGPIVCVFYERQTNYTDQSMVIVLLLNPLTVSLTGVQVYLIGLVH